jgi:hypothetical protein
MQSGIRGDLRGALRFKKDWTQQIQFDANGVRFLVEKLPADAHVSVIRLGLHDSIWVVHLLRHTLSNRPGWCMQKAS